MATEPTAGPRGIPPLAAPQTAKTKERVVFRLEPEQRAGLDRLRERYFDETKVSLSRASVARVLVSQGLVGAEQRKATEVLPDEAVVRAVVRAVGVRRRTR
jgi:hypothetical protein